MCFRNSAREHRTEGHNEMKRGLLARLFYAMASIVIGTLLSLNALTSIILLGWLMILMRNHALEVTGELIGEKDRSSWILGAKGSRGLTRYLGGIVRNLRVGFNAAISLSIATFPFAVFWLVAWWAGWENSFNKGYEQAFVGPMVGISGIAAFAVIMIYLPMAFVHQAFEQRAFAFFELRQVRRIVAQTGWGYVFWAMVTLLSALPIFAGRGLPTFGEGIYPPLADMNSDQVAQLRSSIDLVLGLYVFVTLVALKRRSAGIYARALKRLDDPRTGTIHRAGKVLRFVALAVIWVGLAILIFVGQFLNHEWHIWLTHPYVFLPWIG